jgi:hypothetical protein
MADKGLPRHDLRLIPGERLLPEETLLPGGIECGPLTAPMDETNADLEIGFD